MAIGEVHICNLALGHIGHSTVIQSFDENSNAALRCRLVYDKARDAVLEDMDWSFARRFVTLALAGEAPSFWDFSYAYPDDCLKVRWLYDKRYDRQSDSRVPYEVGLDSDGGTRLIWTGLEFAECRYTQKVTNAGLFPASFVDALSLRIAWEIAFALTSDAAIKRDRQQEYVAFMEIAARNDAGQAEEIYDDWQPSWIEARGSTQPLNNRKYK
ncbi:hypothetical protein [uncultured Tateyamaria sp.]|uniref:hypothetical protein n=1 Tax=uncultured Tateyamaria sp. TaxID=455651 RepID=UPI00261A98E1|nr:hypothetical protein [uncultured Tateyamaria sp.]